MDELELEDDVKQPDEEVEVVSEEPVVEKREAIAPEVGIEALRKQLEEAKEAAAAAERRAAQAESDAYTAKSDKHETDVEMVESAIKMVQRDNDILLAAIKDAVNAGDADRAEDLRAELYDARGKLAKLEEGYAALKGTTVEKPKPVPPSDPVEDFVSRLPSTASKNWIRAHPETVMTEKAQAKLLAAHNLAVNSDIDPDTPEYFASLEQTLGLNKPVVVETESPLSEASKVVEAPQVAPVSRGGGSATRVTLSSAEREMAEMLGMTERDYAKHKVALQKSGRMTAH